MSQRMFNLTKWRQLGDGQSMRFTNPKQRMVTLEVNSPEPCLLYVVQDAESDPERVIDLAAGREVSPLPARGKATFLARVVGRDSVEFGVEGEFELCAEGAGLQVYSDDSEEFSTNVIAPVIFTKLMTRRQRNPQLELMQYMMRLNSERMYGELEQEATRRLEAMERKLESYAPERNTGTPIAEPRSAEPKAPVKREPSDAPAGKAGTDEAKGAGGGAGHKKRKEAAGPDDDQGSFGQAV